jgi:phospho-N-acetylmuramoyl-pentapeptide-transferase
VIQWLKGLGASQTVSSDAPETHRAKQGTTTMGGLLILLGLTLPVVADIALNPGHVSALALLGLTLAFGGIGFLDDLLIARRGKNLGLKARQKLALQFAFAAGFAWWLYATAVPGRTTVLAAGGWSADLGVWYYLLGVFLLVGMSNAINLTDGLDGLAGGVSLMLALALAGTALVSTTTSFGWLPLFGGALAGGCAGFLWYNIHPAQVFMGDTGSLGLGAALAGMSMLGKTEVELQGFALIPWAATFSVIIQVLVFKARKRRHGLEYAKAHRVFRRTPLHHHFEECGFNETKIVGRFWLVTALAIAVTLAITAGR